MLEEGSFLSANINLFSQRKESSRERLRLSVPRFLGSVLAKLSNLTEGKNSDIWESYLCKGRIIKTRDSCKIIIIERILPIDIYLFLRLQRLVTYVYVKFESHTFCCAYKIYQDMKSLAHFKVR